MQAITLRCPACGSTLKVEGNETHIKCEFCQNPINFIKPLTSNSIVTGLNEIEQIKYSNYLSILEQAMLAGNYTEGYNYCNKGLEINPNSAELWANKAICSLWISTISQISEEKAMEIITYLNACKRNDPNSTIYDETSKSIAENLYYCALYRYNIIQPDQYNQNSTMTYSKEAERAVISCIKIIQLCFQINPNYSYLIQELRLINTCKVYLFTNKGQNSNVALRNGFDAVKTRLKLIEEIKKDYTQEKLESMAQNKYDEFCKLSNDFSGIDRSFYNQVFVPLLNQYRPAVSPEAIRLKKKNKKICIGILIIMLLALAVMIGIAYFNAKNEKEKSTNQTQSEVRVGYTDAEQKSKIEYDSKYLYKSFLKNYDKTVFSQETLVLVNSDFDEKKANEVAKYYTNYYKKTAEQLYNNRYVLTMWFYTKTPSSGYNPSTLTEYEVKKEKNLFGYVFYNYDSKKYSGTIEVK